MLARFNPNRMNFVAVIAIGVVLDRYVNYLAGGQPLLLGQPASVIATYAYVAVVFVFWLTDGPIERARSHLGAFLFLSGLAWLVHLGLYRIHGDAFNYTALLYLPILVMVALKPPNKDASIQASLAFAWSVTIVLIATRAMEMLGALEIRPQAANIQNFDERNYFLPLNELVGIEGRWPGPFGHNGDTAMMGALLMVIAVAFWSRASWIFLATGALTLILTNGRASIGAAVVGLIIIYMFTSNPRVNRIPRRWRISTGLVLLTLGAVLMVLRPAGLTGREIIWPAFLSLFRESLWLGVGGSGFATGNEITERFGHAHSLYIEELARFGLVGFVSLAVALGLGIFIAAKAANLGCPGPLAVMVAYFVTGITEPRNNWIEPSATGFLLILMVLAASAQNREHPSRVRPEESRSIRQ